MIERAIAFVFISMLAIISARAQAPTPAPAPAAVSQSTPPRPVNRIAPAYSEADRTAGVQGTVALRGTVQLDGTVTDASIAESSRSRSLDEAALTAFRQWTFTPATENGQPVVAPVEQRMAFYKDTLDTLAEKTCADLMVDVEYFRRTFPESDITDMPLNDISVGLVTVMRSGSLTVESLQRSTRAFARTVEWCSTHPDGRYLDRFLRFAR